MRTLPRAMTCLLLLCDLNGAADPVSAPIEVYVENADSPLLEKEIIVKHHSSSMRFEVDPGTIRYRYKLEGLDKDWVKQSGEMKLFIRFLNEKRDQIDRGFYFVNGDSEGWLGSVESSTFTAREEELTVPEGADSLYFGISSTGPPATVGFFAVTEIGVHAPSLGEDVDYLSTAVPPPGERRSIWNRSGTHPSMASSLLLDDGEGESRVLMIEDDDILAHADWSLKIEIRPTVRPGEKVTLRWREAYSVGLGDPITVNYDRLPPGDYRFIVEGLDLAGIPLGQVSTVSVRVTRPFWENPWFWAATLVAVATLSSMWGRHRARKKISREQRHSQLIADERLRIARDLHDDLGTRLSHINLLGSHAESTSLDGMAGQTFQQITRMSRELMGSLSETVWMLNPSNGDLESLVNFLCRLVGELCKLAEIRCRIDALSVDESMPVSHEFRHNVSLAVKETINNALKHSSASEIRMKVSKLGQTLEIVIEDNGVGIDPNLTKTGSGLGSVIQRMSTIGGQSTLEPLSEGGVKVTLEAPIRE